MFKILVVDDERLECFALKETLEHNFENCVKVKTEFSGQCAVDTACIWKADLILLDIEMPVMNGIEAAKKIKKHLSDCIIIFLTAYDVFEYALGAIKLGADEYLLKPASDEEVISVVGSKLGLYKKPTEELENTFLNLSNDKTGQMMCTVDVYLRKNYMHSISLESVADTVNLNPIYFSKLFKSRFRANFIDYLTDIRVSVAKEMLINLSLNTKEIGEMVGYYDSNYFAKIFKKKVGMTPTDYRNHLKI